MIPAWSCGKALSLGTARTRPSAFPVLLRSCSDSHRRCAHLSGGRLTLFGLQWGGHLLGLGERLVIGDLGSEFLVLGMLELVVVELGLVLPSDAEGRFSAG